jgi:D-alanyl-D-alanine endopeptidase (penicillin-binding protein 7)
MHKIFFILILLSSVNCWGKPAAVIDDPDTLTARSWLVADADNKVLGSKNTGDVRSIASITKVFTVLTVMLAKQDLNQNIRYNKQYWFTRQELIDMAMVKSDNRAAELLCENYPTGYNKCIEDMNIYAKSWGMTKTTLVDATGLQSGNVSTAEDLLKLLHIAEQNYLIVNAASKTKVEINIKKKWLIFKQTNPLIGKKHKFIVSKTGTTNAAGGCIVLTLQTDKGLRRVVVLGSKNGRTRIPEAEFIYEHVN